MTTLTSITESQENKEVTANQNFNAVSPAGIFAKDESTSSGLTWTFFGGYIYVDGTATPVSDGSLSLTQSTTNYIEATRAGVVSANTTGFTAGAIPLYEATTSTTAVTASTDYRVTNYRNDSRVVQAMADANQTLTAVQARADVIETTGALTANRNLVVPDAPRQYTIDNQCSGAFGVVVKTSGGTGITVANGKTAIVRSDGTNVRRVTADV